MKDNASKKEKTVERVSRIKKTIKRTVLTAAFENVIIENSIEEDITWTTFEERKEKVDNWTDVLIDDFRDTYEEIMSELGLTEKNAYSKIKSNASPDGKPDTTLDGIDDYDELEDFD